MREHGGMIVDGRQVASTLQCPHCGGHFESKAGSGRRRAWCSRCMAVTCGAIDCRVCIPIEAKFDHVEGKKTKYDDLITRLVGEGGVLL